MYNIYCKVFLTTAYLFIKEKSLSSERAFSYGELWGTGLKRGKK